MGKHFSEFEVEQDDGPVEDVEHSVEQGKDEQAPLVDPACETLRGAPGLPEQTAVRCLAGSLPHLYSAPLLPARLGLNRRLAS